MTTIAPGAVVSPTEPSLSARKSATTDSGFRIPSSLEMAAQTVMDHARTAPSVMATSAMLALQEQTASGAGCEAELADREARRHGREILDALAALQKALLASAGSAESLTRLAVLAHLSPTAHDPELARVLSSIRLRAQLEIMRRTPRSPDPDYAPAAAPITVPVTGS